MPRLREVRDILLVSHSHNIINEEEFCLLYDLNKSSKLDLPYWTYSKFDLDTMNDGECKSEFRFFRNDVYRLGEILNIPEELVCYNGVVCNKYEALCILLKRYAYPCRFLDMIPRFGRPVPQLSMITQRLTDIILQQWTHLLTTMNQNWLSPQNLENYAQAINHKGAPLTNCWGFIDGTVRPVSKPGMYQRVLYNGHKRVHALKFQSVVAPNGINRKSLWTRGRKEA